MDIMQPIRRMQRKKAIENEELDRDYGDVVDEIIERLVNIEEAVHNVQLGIGEGAKGENYTEVIKTEDGSMIQVKPLTVASTIALNKDASPKVPSFQINPSQESIPKLNLNTTSKEKISTTKSKGSLFGSRLSSMNKGKTSPRVTLQHIEDATNDFNKKFDSTNEKIVVIDDEVRKLNNQACDCEIFQEYNREFENKYENEMAYVMMKIKEFDGLEARLTVELVDKPIQYMDFVKDNLFKEMFSLKDKFKKDIETKLKRIVGVETTMSVVSRENDAMLKSYKDKIIEMTNQSRMLNDIKDKNDYEMGKFKSTLNELSTNMRDELFKMKKDLDSIKEPVMAQVSKYQKENEAFERELDRFKNLNRDLTTELMKSLDEKKTFITSYRSPIDISLPRINQAMSYESTQRSRTSMNSKDLEEIVEVDRKKKRLIRNIRREDNRLNLSQNDIYLRSPSKDGLNDSVTTPSTSISVLNTYNINYASFLQDQTIQEENWEETNRKPGNKASVNSMLLPDLKNSNNSPIKVEEQERGSVNKSLKLKKFTKLI